MKIISIFLVLCLINASITSGLGAWFGSDDDTDSSSVDPDDGKTETVGLLVDNLESQNNDAVDDSGESASNEDNQSGDTVSSTLEPNMADLMRPDRQPNQPNPLSAERLPEPDYRSVNMRGNKSNIRFTIQSSQ